MIKDEPPLIFHSTEEQAPGLKSGYAEAIEGYRKSLPEHLRHNSEGPADPRVPTEGAVWIQTASLAD